METMTSISNAQIKLIKSLSSKKFRDQYGLFTVEGEKLVSEAERSGFEVVERYRREEIGEQTMARISALSSPSPALAVVRKPSAPPFPGTPGRGLFLALDSVRDPGNLGTILRIADWFGIDGVFASPDTVDPYNPKVVQASMGAIFRVKFQYIDLLSFAHDVLQQNGKLYGTFLNGTNLYETALDTGHEKPSVIVMGNESEGISSALASCIDRRLYIPPYPPDDPGSESLNVAIATAVTVAEFRRRG